MTKAIPTKCLMPDLGQLEPLVPATIIQALIGDPAVSAKTAAHRRNFTRLVDKAIAEYQLARASILHQMDEARRPAHVMEREGRRLYILNFTNHLETCINAVHRLLKILDRLKSESVTVPRQLRREIEASSGDLALARNAVEHMDEWVQYDEIPAGTQLMLGLSEGEDAAEIGGVRIQFAELAATIRRLHALGGLLFPRAS